MIELFDSLGILFPNILIQFTSFLIFVWVMYKVLYGPLQRALQERQARIRDSLNQADEMQVRVEEDRKQFEADQREQQDRVRRARDASMQRVRDLEEEQIRQAREAAEKIRIDAEQDAASMRDKALREAQREISTLVIEATSKVLDRTIDDSEHRRLVDEALAEVRSQTS